MILVNMDEFCIKECDFIFEIQLIFSSVAALTKRGSTHEGVLSLDSTNLHWGTASQPNQVFDLLGELPKALGP